MDTLNFIVIKFKYYLKRFIIICVIAHILLVIFIVSASMYLKNNNPGMTSLMLYRKYFYGHDVKPVGFLPLDKIPCDITKMAIATEDYRFYEHIGIDIEAIKRAYIINRKVGYRMYGGSTISQQLSRTLFLFPRKLLIRKYIEVLITLGMECILTKDRILELYLNYCEWGKGIFGVERAAEFWYRKNVNDLTIDETARMITILASPIAYGPYTFHYKKFLANRYYVIKLRYYTYLKFQNL